MKLDINALRRAVNKKLISEQESGFEEPVGIHAGSHTTYDIEHEERQEEGGEEMEMVKQNLFQLSVYAAKLHDMLQDGQEVEEWVQEKVVEATTKISDIYHHLEYKAYKESE